MTVTELKTHAQTHDSYGRTSGSGQNTEKQLQRAHANVKKREPVQMRRIRAEALLSYVLICVHTNAQHQHQHYGRDLLWKDPVGERQKVRHLQESSDRNDLQLEAERHAGTDMEEHGRQQARCELKRLQLTV
eukprot:6181840-Pleurochrysis_carterae.AAC.8